MKPPPDSAAPRDLDAASAALADAQRIDWSAFATQQDDTLEGLRLLEDVALAFRDIGAHADAAAPTDTPLFQWGTLHVRAPLGRGAVGEVWRAFDPALQRDVALKLRPADAAHDDNAAFLSEARHLARLRHRHVLAVYGVAEHEGRAGLWSELIEGRTLAALVNQSGPLPREEALRIGHELASALVAIHGAGMIHGDVKAENVMREPGGRSVLMDFGAAGGNAEVAARSVLQATPRYLPPEVREGRVAPSAAIDLFALGVLLHLLLSGRYPEPRQSLAALRPDLDAPLCALVDGAVADDPAQRPRDASAFASQLARLLAPAPVAARGTRTGLILAAIALLVAVVALVASLLVGRFTTTKTSSAWHAEASFLDPVGNKPRTDGTMLKLGDQIALRVQTTQPAFVYVLNEDAEGRVHLLFPVAALDQGNPVPAQTTVLPGRARGEEVSWAIDSASSREEFVALVSPRSLPQLEARLAQVAAAQVTAEPARRSERGAAALAPRTPQAPTLTGANLRELIAMAQRELGANASQLTIRVLAAPQQ